MEEPQVGSSFYGILAVSVSEGRNKLRVRPIDNQPVPSDWYIQCASDRRAEFKPGTIFKVNVKVYKGPKNGKYLRSKKNELLTVDEYDARL